jgi:hypothetical protein
MGRTRHAARIPEKAFEPERIRVARRRLSRSRHIAQNGADH